MAFSASLFSQMLALIPQTEFARIVQKHRSNRYTKKFSAWDHLVAMLFCQIGQAKSLREICGGLATCLGKLSHLGVNAPPKRSTLAYANEHRSHVFSGTFFTPSCSTLRRWARGARSFAARTKSDQTLLQGFETEPEGQDLRGPLANAVQIQIWTALIAILLFKIL